jgi:hypothetical protein
MFLPGSSLLTRGSGVISRRRKNRTYFIHLANQGAILFFFNFFVGSVKVQIHPGRVLQLKEMAQFLTIKYCHLANHGLTTA